MEFLSMTWFTEIDIFLLLLLSYNCSLISQVRLFPLSFEWKWCPVFYIILKAAMQIEVLTDIARYDGICMTWTSSWNNSLYIVHLPWIQVNKLIARGDIPSLQKALTDDMHSVSFHLLNWCQTMSFVGLCRLFFPPFFCRLSKMK